MQREVIAELLDRDLGSPQEIAQSLVDLRHINQWFGGTRTTITLLRRVARESGSNRMSLLEIGSGCGDVPLAAGRALKADGVDLEVTLLDSMWSHLPANGAASVAGDAMRLPFREGAFDVVGCTLFAHHFQAEELQSLLAESLRVSRRAVMINDLIRSRLHLLLVYMGLPLFRSPITWHDAPASVRNAYTQQEMRALLDSVTAPRVEITRHYLYRMGVLLWK